MGEQSRAEQIGVIELGYVPDVFVSGITEVEERGDHVRVTLYSERKIDAGSRVERIVVAHIVMTNDGFQRALRVALGAMKHCAPECPRRSPLS